MVRPGIRSWSPGRPFRGEVVGHPVLALFDALQRPSIVVTAVVPPMLVMVSPVMPVLVVAVALVMLVVSRDHRSVAMTPTAVLVVVLPVMVPVLVVSP